MKRVLVAAGALGIMLAIPLGLQALGLVAPVALVVALVLDIRDGRRRRRAP